MKFKMRNLENKIITLYNCVPVETRTLSFNITTTTTTNTTYFYKGKGFRYLLTCPPAKKT